MRELKVYVLLGWFILLHSVSIAQNATLHGTIKDAASGEALIGASIVVEGTSTGVVTNPYGFYSLTLPMGDYKIRVSYVGYYNVLESIALKEDLQLDIDLRVATEVIDEVVVTTEARNHNVTSADMGVQKISAKTIEQIPVIFGEADVIKAIKLLPGVSTTSETSSNISVRGGGRDQNLILLDEANVYSVSHMLGIFSVFNNDAIRNVEFYKGAIPAEYGGRLASVIDIRMKEGNMRQFSGSGNVGLLSAKLTLEVPVVKDKLSVLLSGRRTYFDILSAMVERQSDKVTKIPYFFYDYNAKINFKLNEKHRFYLSGYFGRDIIDLAVDEDNRSYNDWGNYTGTFRWNYIINKRLFMNTTLLSSNYDFLMKSEQRYGKDKKESIFNWEARMKDYSLKMDYGFFLNSNNTLKFGGIATYHDFSTGDIHGKSDTVSYSFRIPKYYFTEYALYLSNRQKIADKFEFEYGVRASMFQNIGPGTEYILENYKLKDTKAHSKNKVYNTYSGLEPRFSMSYALDARQSIKMGYSYNNQYLHIASNALGGTPIEVWMPSTINIKPQKCHQVTVGYFRNFFDNTLETSVEAYYKKMDNQIEFREFSQPYLNEFIEEEFRFGEGRAMGLEFLVRKPAGRLNGWVSYTLSKAERKIDDYWETGWYRSSYDMPHNLSVVGSYDLTSRWSVSSNFVFQSGKPFDAPVLRWEYGESVLQQFEGKNMSRYPNYHRLDLGIERKGKPGKRFQSSWRLSVYNVYNRKNANSIYFTPDDENQNITRAYKFSIMPRIYSISYNFNF